MVKRKRKYVRTTQSAHWMKVYKNLIKEEEAQRPEQVFVADITYLETMEGYCYLSLITDGILERLWGMQ